jgi:hypothetical protein
MSDAKSDLEDFPQAGTELEEDTNDEQYIGSDSDIDTRSASAKSFQRFQNRQSRAGQMNRERIRQTTSEQRRRAAQIKAEAIVSGREPRDSPTANHVGDGSSNVRDAYLKESNWRDKMTTGDVDEPPTSEANLAKEVETLRRRGSVIDIEATISGKGDGAPATGAAHQRRMSVNQQMVVKNSLVLSSAELAQMVKEARHVEEQRSMHDVREEMTDYTDADDEHTDAALDTARSDAMPAVGAAYTDPTYDPHGQNAHYADDGTYHYYPENGYDGHDPLLIDEAMDAHTQDNRRRCCGSTLDTTECIVM